MIELSPIDVLGFAAGAIIASSALPQIMKFARNPNEARAQSVIRNAMLVMGNGMWVVFGTLTNAVPIAAMCALGMLLNAAVLVWAVAARQDERAQSSQVRLRRVKQAALAANHFQGPNCQTVTAAMTTTVARRSRSRKMIVRR